MNNNGRRIRDKYGRYTNPQEQAARLMSHLSDDGMRKYVEEWERINKISEHRRTDLSDDIDVVNNYAAILGINIVHEWIFSSRK